MLSGVSPGTIISPFLALISYTMVPIPTMIASLTLTVPMFIKYKKSIDIKSIFVILSGSILGILIIIFIMQFILISNINLLLGSLVLLAVFISLIMPNISPRGKLAFLSGIISSIMGGLAGVGGQILALLYQNEKIETIKASLSLIYVIWTIFLLIGFYYSDNLNISQLWLGLYLTPGFILGFFISPLFVSKFNPKYAKPTILWLSAIGGVMLIVKHFKYSL